VLPGLRWLQSHFNLTWSGLNSAYTNFIGARTLLTKAKERVLRMKKMKRSK